MAVSGNATNVKLARTFHAENRKYHNLLSKQYGDKNQMMADSYTKEGWVNDEIIGFFRFYNGT
ncbi:MAG: hypothetical protein LBU29_04335 [Endomicrobium sp.]|nr:hypothetical protein [Endomicrobium sp.]